MKEKEMLRKENAELIEQREAIEIRMAFLEEAKLHLENQLASAQKESNNSYERIQELARELGKTRARVYKVEKDDE